MRLGRVAEQARREVILERIETMTALVEAQIHFLTATGQLVPYLNLPNLKLKKP